MMGGAVGSSQMLGVHIFASVKVVMQILYFEIILLLRDVNYS
jgi:hypothetical protein